jgi:hypothetical protein
MTIDESIDYVASKYVYTDDPSILKDAWFVMRHNANDSYRGDCEDFSLTVFWFLCCGSLFEFIKNIFIGNYRFHIVASNGGGNNHCVGEFNGFFFDNWTKQALPKRLFFEVTGHVYGHKINRFTVMCKLIVGLFYR